MEKHIFNLYFLQPLPVHEVSENSAREELQKESLYTEAVKGPSLPPAHCSCRQLPAPSWAHYELLAAAPPQVLPSAAPPSTSKAKYFCTAQQGV